MALYPANLLIPPETFLSRMRYEATYGLSSLTMTLGFSMRAAGSCHVPGTGPALLVANHQSFLDPLLVGLACRRQLCYLARQTLFHNPLFAWLIRGLNAVPIDQEGIGKEGIKTVLALLKAGRAVVVFPEGERTGNGAMQELRPGIQLLVKRTEAPVVPVGIAGSYHAWPRWRKYPLPAPLFLPASARTIAVAIGHPLDSSRLATLSRQQVLEALFRELQTVAARAEQLRRK